MRTWENLVIYALKDKSFPFQIENNCVKSFFLGRPPMNCEVKWRSSSLKELMLPGRNFWYQTLAAPVNVKENDLQRIASLAF